MMSMSSHHVNGRTYVSVYNDFLHGKAFAIGMSPGADHRDRSIHLERACSLHDMKITNNPARIAKCRLNNS